MSNFLRELRHACRSLRGAPGFSLLVILTLALGLGANVALFTLVDGVLLRPLDFRAPGELFALQSGKGNSISLADFEDWRRETKSATGMTALCFWLFNLTGSGEPERLQGARATANFFDVMGVPPALGRYFRPAEDRGDLVVLGYGLWQRRFAGRADAIGAKLILNGVPSTVIGVAPARFRYPDEQVELWSPIGKELEGTSRAGRFFYGIARIPAGKAGAVTSELAASASRLAKIFPDTNANVGADITPLKQVIVGDSRPALLLLFGAIAITLLVTSANLVNLALARATTRTNEIAIRLSLGATRWSLVRLLTAEGLVLVGTGIALAILTAKIVVGAIVAYAPKDIPRLDFVSLDGTALLYAAIVSIATLAFLVAGPMWSIATGPLSRGLSESGRTSTAASGLLRLRGVLVMGEIALTTVLMIGGGLLTRSLFQVLKTAPGFATENRLAMRVFPVGPRYNNPLASRSFISGVVEKMAALPGVADVTASSHVPLGGAGTSQVRALADDGRIAPGAAPTVDYRAISPGYFHFMAIPLLKGRDFMSQDNESAPGVIVVNQRMAKQFWPNEDPIGKKVRWLEQDADTGVHTVVGVAADVKQFGLEKDDHPTAYAPYMQRKFPWLRWMNFIARSQTDPTQLAAAMRGVLGSADPALPVFEVSTLEQRLRLSLAPRRFLLILMMSLAVLALALGLVGIYGVMSYLMMQRRAEFAIRMALGATNRDVIRLVLERGVWLTTAGLAAGLIAALGLGRYMQHILFGVTPKDPLVLLAATALVISAGALATIVPAMRAARSDPASLLRS